MPPWSSRLISPSSRNESHSTPPELQPANANGTLPANSQPQRPSESDILEHAYGIPSLPPNPQSKHGASATSRPARDSPGHGRSMSHPFPSIFNGKNLAKNKKRDGASKSGGVGAVGFDSATDDELFSPVKKTAGNMGAGTSKGKIPDKDLRTGNCMTCDSMVRWPKDLKVFRCSVCLTINDLTPVRLDARKGDGQRIQPGASSAGHTVNIPPLSVEKTKHLIDKCITAYLLSRLRDEDNSRLPPPDARFAGDSNKLHAPSRGFPVSPSRTKSDYLSSSPTNPVHDSEHSNSSEALHGMYQRRHPSFNNDRPARPSRSPVPSPKAPGPPRNHVGHTIHRKPLRKDSSVPVKRSEEPRKDSTEMSDDEISKQIFKPVEEYIIASFGSYDSINLSFSSARPNLAPRAASEGNSKNIVNATSWGDAADKEDNQLSEMDAKTLLIGDFAENGFWWTGERSNTTDNFDRPRKSRDDNRHNVRDFVTVKSPRIDWSDLGEWYHIVTHTSRGWRRRLDEIVATNQGVSDFPTEQQLEEMDGHLLDAQNRIQRVLLKASESLLKRPSRPLTEPGDLRFLLILLANPLLYPSPSSSKQRSGGGSISAARGRQLTLPVRDARVSRTNVPNLTKQPESVADRGSSGQHSGIIKRILGLLSNVSNECHHHIVSWFARYSDSQFQRLADLIGSFVTYRLTRQHGKKRDIEHDPTADLIPNMGSRRGDNTSAALHAALGSAQSQASRKAEKKEQPVVYNDDWQIKAAARVMSLVFSANNSGIIRRGDRRPIRADEAHSAGLAARDRAHKNGQILASSDFYNTLLDYSDLIADFEAWETKKSKFSFCQYPFFLSIWAKIKIMEHDARRQMEVKAREAFFDSIMTRKTVNQYLVLKIRRDCLVEDSLKSVSEVVGTGGEEIKKGLRIEFKGEEGIDAGGLRKEWFLLLVRDVFNPEHGMFTYDDDSQFCYFNPSSFETTDQFFLVGVVLGLAIYNSTILDVALPPFAFRKLLAAAPAATAASASHTKTIMTYTLDDLAEYRPALANGLRQLLEFEGDVESVYCRDFVADIERYGESIQVPLCEGGEKRSVTNANRREFVDLYVRYLLDTAVVRQFEPFKRGFFTVCGGNALSLFRAEEIELLIRGSEEPLDIASLQAVSRNENWGVPNPGETEPVIQWFWDSFQNADPRDQRKLLGFVTGSDRIPAMGATNLIIKLSCLGDDSPRFPIARTCFNQLSLWRYSSKEKLEQMLWRAVNESEGFGLK